MAVAGALFVLVLTGLWHKTQSLDPEDHAHIDSTLRELRSLDRTINQDVLRARYQLINSYQPVLQSYRRIEELEAVLAHPPAYLDADAKKRLSSAVAEYRKSITAKQGMIELFKYKSADLRELLNYLPSAGTGIVQAAESGGDKALAAEVNRVLQQTLIYNLTSDETYAPQIKAQLDGLAVAGEQASSYAVKRRVRTFVLNVRTLLKVKRQVDTLLVQIFDQPVAKHENNVAAVYYAGYASAEHVAGRYRVLLYAMCLALFGVVGYTIRRLSLTAKALAASNERLEERVAERTRELYGRNREMQAVLDNVGQALVSVTMDGQLSRERSAAFERWFPDVPAGTPLWDALGAVNANLGVWVKLGWEQLADEDLLAELVLDQLPKGMTVSDRHYHIEYRPMHDDGKLDRVLVVISDVTENVERKARESDQQEQLVVFQHVMRDRPGFMEFFSECEKLAGNVLGQKLTENSELIRCIHTLKGNAALFGISSVASLCHDLESKLVGGDPLEEPDLARFGEVWSSFAAKVTSLTKQSEHDDRIEFSRADVISLHQAISSGKSSAELLRFLRNAEREPAERRLARISEQAKSLARRLGKGEIVVKTESNDVRLDGERWAHFWAAFVHMLRNALDHGLEPEEERRALGKPCPGQLTLRTLQVDGRVIVEIVDDGRGIDWAAVRAKAVELGIEAESESDLRDLLFRGGLSTKSSVSEYSGRGAGVSACYNACFELGGTVSIESERGKGTTFRFCVPSDEAVAAPLTSAA